MERSSKTREQLIAENLLLKQKIEKLTQREKTEAAIHQQLEASEQQLRAANQQLRAAEQQTQIDKEKFERLSLLRNAILESPQGIIVFALDKQYRYLEFTTLHRQTMKAIWGVDISLGDNMLDIIQNKADRQQAKTNFDRALQGERFILQEAYGDENLKRTFYQDQYGPILNAEMQIIGVAVYVIDITYQKEIEHALKQQVKEYIAINNKYKQQNQELSEINQQLQATEQQLRAANQQLKVNNLTLSESEKKFREMADLLPQMVYETNINGDFTFVNKQAYQTFGYSKEDIKKGLNFMQMVIPGEVDLVRESMKRMFHKIPVDNDELHLLSKKGKKIPVAIYASVIINANKPIGFRGVAINITKRKKAEQELTKLSTAIKQSPAIMAIADPKGDLEYVNPKFTEITGYSMEEALGKNPRILKSGEHPKEMYKALWQTITSGKTWRGQFHNKKKNGELFWESATISPIHDHQGKIINYIKVAEDITEHKRKEEIQKIIYNLSNAVVTPISLHDFAKVVQEELTRIVDTKNFYIALYDKKSDSFSLTLHLDEKDKFTAFPAGKTLTAYVLKTKKPLLATKEICDKLAQSGEIELVGAKSKAWLGVPLLLDEKAIGVMAVQSYENEHAFNRSDIEILEIISRQLSISINRKKQEEELKTALEKAQESDRLKTAFLANMSHEIRTPMNGILGFTSLLNNPALGEAERQKYTSIIATSGERLLNTVNDLIDISKIEAGQIKVSEGEVSINKLLAEEYQFFSLEANAKGLSLVSIPTLNEVESIIITDKAKLHGILSNLIKNAIKFSPKGSVTFGYYLKNRFIEFFIKDTGVGIPKNRQQAVFNRFEQADVGTGYSRKFEGSGLGLAIAKAYVEMLGGKIGLTSEVGKGTTFYFTIPYNTKQVQGAQSTPQQEKPLQIEVANKHLDLLIVEDDETSTMFLKTVLRNKFQKIHIANSGREAIKIFKNHPEIAIILMDIRMTDMNGLEATREIRKFNKEVPIIAQTAFALVGDRKKVIDAGCTDYITKPIDRKKLLEKINRFV